MKPLAQHLWERWGSANHPAEWDGHGGNGGKGSQRFWEYLWAINQIGLPASVLDAGCGSTMFFPDLLSCVVPKVIAVDPLLKPLIGSDYFSVSLEYYVEQFACDQRMQKPEWITCISVLEHVEDKPAFCAALDSLNAPIAMTIELGGGGCIEMPTLYQCLNVFKHHYLSKMEACPVLADNAQTGIWRPLGLVLEVMK